MGLYLYNVHVLCVPYLYKVSYPHKVNRLWVFTCTMSMYCVPYLYKVFYPHKVHRLGVLYNVHVLWVLICTKSLVHTKSTDCGSLLVQCPCTVGPYLYKVCTKGPYLYSLCVVGSYLHTVPILLCA